MNLVLLIGGIYLVGISLISHVQNMKSRMLLKVIPFFIGLFNIVMFFYLQGYINLK